MARMIARGSVLQVTIATVLTTIAQLKSFKVGDQKSQCVDVEALDDSGVGIPKQNIGTVSQDDITGEMYYDPTNATHQFLATTIQTPANFPVACKIKYTNSGTAKESTFSAVGFGLGVNVAVKDVTMANISIETTGIVTHPTS